MAEGCSLRRNCCSHDHAKYHWGNQRRHNCENDPLRHALFEKIQAVKDLALVGPLLSQLSVKIIKLLKGIIVAFPSHCFLGGLNLLIAARTT